MSKSMIVATALLVLLGVAVLHLSAPSQEVAKLQASLVSDAAYGK